MKPADCRTMAEVRHGVDRLDERIVALLAERFRYMDAAARIKPDREAVRDERRKAEVIAKARATAVREDAPAVDERAWPATWPRSSKATPTTPRRST